jgi:predicted flap endonuclease-1-like 5' DNA nuclease
MSYPIDDLKTIGPGVAATFKSCGIRSTGKLLEAAKDPKGRKTLADKTGIPEKDILRSANMADRLRIKGVGEEYAVLLEAAGVGTVRELTYRNPANLAKAMAEANVKRKLGVQLLPSQKTVLRWIEHAKKLQIKISY